MRPPGDGETEQPRPKMAADMAAWERQIAAGRDRQASASAAFRAAVHSARSGAHQTLSREDDLAALKKQLQELEADLAQTLSLKLAKESKCKLVRESISASDATIERLRSLVIGQRNRRAQHAAVVSLTFDAVEALETKNGEDEKWRKDIDEAIFWFRKFLGLQVVAGREGVKFVFDKVDMQNPEKEFSVFLKFDQDSDELLNLTNDPVKFVRMIRQRIQADLMDGTLPVSTGVSPHASPLPISPPVIMSVDSGSRNDPDQSHSQSKSKKRALSAKGRASAVSAASPGSVRRSPRFPGNR